MKITLLTKTMLLLCALAAGSGSMWADDQTITLTYSSFGLETSYKEKTATVSGFGFTVDQGYKGSGNVIQMNSSKGSGILYNTTAIPGLKSIKVNVSSGNKTYTITTGTSEKPTANSQTGTTGGTYNASSGDTYFQLKVSGASYFSSIEITYTPSAGSSDPSIIASNVNITSNATSGSIGYSVENGNGNVTAEITTGDWLTLGTITASEVPFTCEANTSATARTAQVTLSFTGAENKVVTITQAAAPVVAYGNCGTTDHESEVTWVLTGTSPNYALTISGTGAMADYTLSSTGYAPWYSYKSNIKTAIIENGVTKIGNYAFNQCSKLTSVSISSSVETIGQGAFTNCSTLPSVTIPSSVTTISNLAFSNCSALPSVNIHSNVTKIGTGVFADCNALSSITVDAGNSKYDSRENCNAIIETATNTLTNGCKNTTIPSSVRSIGSLAFYHCTTLLSITIPSGVTSIGGRAFDTCTSLPSITIPGSVTSIGENAFVFCSGLTSVNIPSGVTSIGSQAFSYCSKLESVTLNSNPSIGAYAFNNIKSGATITMNLAANEGETGEYWTTFYNRNYNFEISDAVGQNTQIFKAALSDAMLSLTPLETDKIITKNNAVILKSTASPIVLTLTTTNSNNDFDGNNLSGVSSASGLTATGSQYVLNKTAENGVGFYKMASGKVIGVGKAYLTYAGVSLAPAYFPFFEDVDGVEALQPFTVNREPLTEYDLMGRLAKPNSKGIRITKGHIMYVK